MTFETFASQVRQSGLLPKLCHKTHWQILDGENNHVVNVWAHSKRGFRYQAVGEKSRSGTLKDAIDLAGRPTRIIEVPPWEDAPERVRRVGLIRRLWRVIW